MEKSVKAGVAIIVLRQVPREPTREELDMFECDNVECWDTHVLLGLRQGSHAAGKWAAPGGHLEYGETSESCCERELLEECGLAPSSPIQKVGWTEVTYEEINSHHVALFLWCECAEGEPQLLEPNKCVEWRWFNASELPTPMMEQTETFVEMAVRDFALEKCL